MNYNKLVRDRIPDSIKATGRTPITHIAKENEFKKKLEEKLLEEVHVFLIAKNEEEIADILEVLDAICIAYGINREQIKETQMKKAKEHGRFETRTILDDVR